MEELSKLLTLFQGKSLTDIILVGMLDEGTRHCESKVFLPSLMNIYLEFEDHLIRCTSFNQAAQLKMQVSDAIRKNFDFGEDEDFKVPLDEDEEFCTCSVFDLFIRHSQSRNYVSALRVFLDSTCDLDKGIVKCAEFRFDNGSSLFLDPINFYGIRIGGEQQLQEWINDWIGWVKDEHGQAIKFTEYVWENPSIAQLRE